MSLLPARHMHALQVSEPWVWLSLQAYRELAKRHPSFRERSETRDLIVEISLQPWRSFRPDGVILFR